MKFVVIEMQAFCTPEFVPKELAIYDGHRAYCFLLKSPKPFSSIDASDIRMQIKFLQSNHHHIYYDSGNVPYEDLQKILRTYIIDAGVDRVYCKGVAKQKFLQTFMSDCPFETSELEIINTEWTQGCPKFDKGYPDQCENHKFPFAGNVVGKCSCSVVNCKILYNWLISLLPK